jgi:zinc transporter ZupT
MNRTCCESGEKKGCTQQSPSVSWVKLGVGVGVTVGEGVAVGVSVGEGVSVGVAVALAVAVGVGVALGGFGLGVAVGLTCA